LKNSIFTCFIIYILLSFLFCSTAFALSDGKALELQNSVKYKPVGERIAFFAEQFIGAPYDPDPLGAYVRQSVIVSDEKVDCMYLVFRTVELALSSTPGEAVETALERRFHSRGIINKGKVINYDDRFVTGEGMVRSGKWGKEITAEIGSTVSVLEPRTGLDTQMLTPEEALKGLEKLRSGDILFFIKRPSETPGGPLVGHLGIIEIAEKDVYLIHASGRKNRRGIVKKTALKTYLKTMPFIGIKITRFQ